MFRRNVGGIDRILRLTLGPVLILAGLFLLTGTSSLGLVLVIVGLLALLTGLVRVCVLYIPFGISTARPRPSEVKRMREWEMPMNCCGSMPPARGREHRDVEQTTGQAR